MAADGGKIKIETIIDNSKLKDGLDETKKEVEKLQTDIEEDTTIEPEVEPEIDESSLNEVKSVLAKFADGVGDGFAEKLGLGKVTSELGGLSSIVSSLGPEVGAIGAAVLGILVAFKTAKDVANTFKKVLITIGNAIKKVFSVIGSLIKGIVTGFAKIGKSILGIAKSSLKLVGSIFGIHSATDLIQKSLNKVRENNVEIENTIDLITGAIATILEPIVMRIVSLVYTLLSYINQIVAGLTGKDLFASAKKNMSSTAKSAKEVNKQLAGFDEMNVLNDNSGGGGASGSSNALPKIDKSLMDLLKGGSLGALAETISGKIVTSLNILADTIKSIDWTSIGKGISDFLTNIDFSGIFVGLIRVFGEASLGFQDMLLAIDWATVLRNFSKGIADAIFKIDEYINLVKWDKIGIALAEAFVSIDWAGIGNSIITLLWDSLKGIAQLLLNIDWGKVGQTISNTLHSWITTFINIIKETDWIKLGKDIANKIFDFLENVDWLQLAIDILTLFGESIAASWGFLIGVFETLWEKIKGVFSVVGTWFKSKFQEAWNNIKSVFSSVGTFFGNIWNTIKSKFTAIGTKIGEAVGGAFKGVVNTILKYIESTINTAIKGINVLIKGINVVGKTLKLGTIKELKQLSLPRLAKGGIINMPNKGVMVGGAIGGESGREGVLPLTDSQAMEQLGEAIGRYITINANITNTMNGRVISRELQKINNENSFAFNG